MFGRSIAAMGIAAAVSLTAMPANASLYNVSGSVNGYGFNAVFSLTVVGGHATAGTGAISGGGLDTLESLTLVTLSSPGVEDDGGGLLGYRSNDGTDWYNAGTAVPIDENGLIFAIGPNPVGFGTSQQFDIYSDGAGGYEVAFFGAAQAGVAPAYYAYNIPVSVSVSGVPEASTWSMMVLAFGGLAAVGGIRIRRARAA